jgi:hypothetical protein
MKLERICAAIFAAVVVCGSAVLAKDRPAAASGLRAIQIDCMKQYGAYEDPATKRLKIEGGITEIQTRTDAIYACVAQKTGKPAVPFMSGEIRFH